MAKAVDSSKAGAYITKAENSLFMAKIAFEKGMHDNALMSSVHSSINALDALPHCILAGVHLGNILTCYR